MEAFTSWLELLGVSGLVVALFMWRIEKMDRTQARREAARVEESVLIMQGLQAFGHLSEATALALRNGHTNGEMEAALKYYTKARDDINVYLLKQNALRNQGK